MDVEKYYDENGQVAVLWSPGFGAGWSTWSDDEQKEFALFDKGLVELALNLRDDDVEKYIESKLGENNGFYTGGWEDIQVKWMTEGTHFTIEEYDGSESFRFKEDISFVA